MSSSLLKSQLQEAKRRVDELKSSYQSLTNYMRNLRLNLKKGRISLSAYRREVNRTVAQMRRIAKQLQQAQSELRRVEDAYQAALAREQQRTPPPPSVKPTPQPTPHPEEPEKPDIIPPKPVEPEDEASGGVTPQPGPERGYMRYMKMQTELLAQQGRLAPLEPSGVIGEPLAKAITDLLHTIGLDPQALEELHRSPVDPEKAAQYAESLRIAAYVGIALLYSVGIAAEVASLGQVDGVTWSIMSALSTFGIESVVGAINSMPWQIGLLEPAKQYYNAKYQPYLPGVSDLIRFVVREVITPEEFEKVMARQGFSKKWADAYWEAHWRDIAEQRIHEAYHRGIITREDRDKFLVLLDYRPTPRPGISKSDLEIVRGLSKTLLGRIELRRLRRLGVIDDKELEKRMSWLGYEDDSPLAARAEKLAAFEGLQNAVIREAGYLFSEGKITQDDFINVYKTVRETHDELKLWLMRFILRKQRKAKVGGEEESVESPEESAEEELG